jgi:hypothetical protein
MQFRLQWRSLFFMATTRLLLSTTVSQSQEDSTPKEVAKFHDGQGFIGGEAHESYVIRARKGQTMTVRIS